MTELDLGAVAARGPLTEALVARLRTAPAAARELPPLAATCARQAARHSLFDEDVQLALTVLYELHYRGVRGVDGRWEWHPDLLAVTAALESVFEQDLRALTAARLPSEPVPAAGIAAALTAMIRADDSPSVSRYLARRATREQLVELLMHRSIYHLKEADPHSWAIPRLAGAPKAALVEIQADEYGAGRPERMHSALFAQTMRELDLDDRYGAYLDAVPAVTLAWVNTMTFLGLHRRLRGAAVGHLAATEMDSSLPNRLYGNGLRRLGLPVTATDFYDEHVEADAVHEQIAAHDLVGRLAAEEPQVIGDILFGAAASLAVGGLAARHLLDAWEADRSSLRPRAVPVVAGA